MQDVFAQWLQPPRAVDLRRLAAIAAFAASPFATAAEPDRREELGCDGEWARTPLCVERAKALEARAKIEAVLHSLADVPQPPWVLEDHAAARAFYDEGLELFRDEYFGDAAVRFDPALKTLLRIQREYSDLVDNAVAGAEAQLAKEDFGAALDGFTKILAAWEPDHVAARAGAAQALAGQNATRMATEAIEMVENGQPQRARALLDSIATDARVTAVDKAYDALSEYETRRQVNADITAGHAALDRMDAEAAVQAFRDALTADPESDAARDGLAEALRRTDQNALDRLRQDLAGQLAQESWTDAIPTIRRIATLEPAADEVRRLPELADLVQLEARLDSALSDPRRATAKAHRSETRAVIASTREPARVGERIHAKGQQLEQRFNAWTLPVPVTIHSDNRSEIVIRPGRELGRFRTTELSVYPGRYTLLARRSGFRERRIELSVQPESEPIVLELVCDERF